MSVDECCLVCAEPLEWTAFGPCGHKETCSKCVSRLRSVLKDKRCVLCQQESEQVFFTRFMGDYTARVAPEDFDQLKARAASKELYYLPGIDGYFDDQKHYEELKSMCGITHPKIAEAGPNPPTFGNIDGLRKFIERNFKQMFCDLCLVGRKVFVCEQVLYTRQELDRHNKQGDESGPLAESGFKGHPICRFCGTRFYDSSELYRHMEQNHEHCFICRRSQPSKYVYYRNYHELEEHFVKQHHPCPHPSCLEQKFVVFGSEPELKRHFAQEHGDDLKMSRAQRREALSIPIQLQFRRGDEQEPGYERERVGTVIGGGDNVPSRHGRRNNNYNGAGSSMRASRSHPEMAAALQESAAMAESLAAAGGEGGAEDSVTFTAEDFPVVEGRAGPASGPMGRWNAYAASSGSRAFRPEEFPALPTMTRGAKKRSKQQGSLADQLRAGAQPVRVINRAAAGAPQPGPGPGSSGAGCGRPASAAAGGGSGAAAQPPHPDDFPSLPAAPLRAQPPPPGPAPFIQVSARNGRPASARPASNSAAAAAGSAQNSGYAVLAALEDDFPTLGGGPAPPPAPPPGFSPAPAASPSGLLNLGVNIRVTSKAGAGKAKKALNSSLAAAADTVPSPSSPAFAAQPEDFPGLGPSSAPPVAPPPQFPPTRPAMSAALMKAAQPPAPPPQLPPAPSAPPEMRPEDFPSLPSSSSSKKGRQHQRPAASSAQPSGGGGGAVEVAGGPSPSLKAANKALIEKIKNQLDQPRFQKFKQESSEFMSGALRPDVYHERVVGMGVTPLVPDLCALCPDEARRNELLAAHVAYLSSAAAQDPSRPGWVPPEAAMAAAARAEQSPSWPCPRCPTINAPLALRCEICKTLRPAPGSAPRQAANGSAHDAPPASGGAESSDASTHHKKKEKKKANLLLSEAAASQEKKVHPQNVWTQNHALKKPVQQPRK